MRAPRATLRYRAWARLCAPTMRDMYAPTVRNRYTNMNAKPTMHERYTHTDSIPSHCVPVQEALFIAFMDDPNGKSGGTAMMSKVFEMKKKFNMGFHSFHDYEHSGMPAMPDGTPMFWFINTGWFMICGKTPPDAISRNFDKLRLWSAKCEFNIEPKKVVGGSHDLPDVRPKRQCRCS